MRKICLPLLFIVSFFNIPHFTYAYTTNMNANIVVGQADFTHDAYVYPNTTRISLNSPTAVYTDGTKLYITDYDGRMLIYNSLPTSNNPSPDVALGVADFTSQGDGCGVATTASTFCPYGNMIIAEGKLILTDGNNGRVLIWNTVPTTMGAPADIVIGQTSLTTPFSNQNQGGSVAANTLNYNTDVQYDVASGKLIIADGGNNRILIFNHIPNSNNASADLVIGQQDFTQNSDNQGGAVAANTLNNPTGTFIINGKLFIADYLNHRVLIFNHIPTSNNASADLVIGQQDFTHNSSNQGGSVGPNTLSYPTTTAWDGKRLFINDPNNHRVLIFDGIPTANNVSAIQVIGQQDFTQNSANQGGSLAQNTLGESWVSIYAYKNQLFVPDYSNNRALIYNNVTSALPSPITATPSNTSATLTYITSTATSEYVDYGTTSSYGSNTGLLNNNPRLLSHTVTLSGLRACTTYHFQVTATDASLQDQVSSDQTFTTTCMSNSSSNETMKMPEAPQCGDEKPSSAPYLFQAEATNKTVTLHINPAGMPYNKYYVAYGLNYEGSEMYGVEFNQDYSTGAITYKINELSANTVYYFKIRAGNGCMPGQWSNNFKIKTTGSKGIIKTYLSFQERVNTSEELSIFPLPTGKATTPTVSPSKESPTPTSTPTSMPTPTAKAAPKKIKSCFLWFFCSEK